VVQTLSAKLLVVASLVYSLSCAVLAMFLLSSKARHEIPKFCWYVCVSLLMSLPPRYPDSRLWHETWWLAESIISVGFLFWASWEFSCLIGTKMFVREYRALKCGLVVMAASCTLIFARYSPPQTDWLLKLVTIKELVNIELGAALVLLSSFTISAVVRIPTWLKIHGLLLSTLVVGRAVVLMLNPGTGIAQQPVPFWDWPLSPFAKLFPAACFLIWAVSVPRAIERIDP
jgi:hypothetical protein